MEKGARIPQVRVPAAVQLLTGFSPYQPYCPAYEKKGTGHRKLLWVIFLEADPNTEDPNWVTKSQGSL